MGAAGKVRRRVGRRSRSPNLAQPIGAAGELRVRRQVSVKRVHNIYIYSGCIGAPIGYMTTRHDGVPVEIRINF